jgi:hypothetical protein
MLGFALAPDRAIFRPLVTILIPVFNRAGPLVEAVQSCLDQTWRPIEILVVDDGSEDDPASALARFGDRVRLVRKPNGGVASARNLGLRLACGDFVHFLDSDDLLCRAAIDSKIAAFAAVADADLCYGQSQWIDMRVSPPRVKALRLRELDNPIRSMIVAFAFPVPSVMIPRWRMLTMPPFEEDLRRSSDFRYWQALGFAGIKAIGIRTQAAVLRRFQQSLHENPQPDDDHHAVALLRGLRDLLRHPGAWPYAVEYLNILTSERARDWLATGKSERLGRILPELVAALREGSAAIDGQSLSMLPVLAAMRNQIEQLRRHGHWRKGEPNSAYAVLAAAILQGIETAPPITDRDIVWWTCKPDAPLRYRRLHTFFTEIERRCPRRRGAALADSLLRKAPKVPRRKQARLATWLRPLLGARLAGSVVASWMRRRG